MTCVEGLANGLAKYLVMARDLRLLELDAHRGVERGIDLGRVVHVEHRLLVGIETAKHRQRLTTRDPDDFGIG